MVDPFFKSKKPANSKPRPAGNNNNRPRTNGNGSLQKRKRNNTLKKNLALDQQLAKNVSSDEESGNEGGPLGDVSDDEDEVEETAEEKRLRLAKLYLEGLKVPTAEDALEIDAKEIDKEIIASRLHRDVLETEGVLNSLVASEFPSDISKLESRFKKCHQSPLTCVLADPSNTHIYTASLDNSITQWDFQTLQKVKVIPGARRKVKKFEGHTDNVMCLAISSNGQFLASGGKDKNIIIWKLPSLEYVGELKQHKDTVTALCFRKNSLDLYSASLDRMIKVWNVESMGYVETLYGHQDGILGLSSLAKEQCVSVGGRDRSLRCWQIINSGQLILRGGIQSKYILPKDYDLSNTLEQVVDNLDHIEEAENDKGKILKYMEGSLDCCGHIDEDHFVSGGDSGTLSVWSITRKKPVYSLNLAHGINPENLQPYPILSIAICPYTDVVITGSYSGAVKFWKINTQSKFNVEELISYDVEGYINGISICMSNESPKADLEGKTPEFTALLAVGRHFSHGRWNFEKFGRNGFQKIVVPLENKPKTFE